MWHLDSLLPRCIGLISGCVLLTTCAADQVFSSPADAQAEEVLRPCQIEGSDETLLCGAIEAPENPANPNGRSISLNIVVAPAIGADTGVERRLDPWVEIPGGPGNAATDFVRLFTGDLRYLREGRDVLLVDQRGTGGSSPLFCEELSVHRVSSLFPRFPAKETRDCRNRLSKTADLSQYSTQNAAHDLEIVRQKLGYQKLNLFGSSYGTRFVLEYMRLYPEHVRAAMLWGVVPPDFRRPLFYARDGQRAFDILVEDCKADPACSVAYPDLHADLAAAMAQITARQLVFDIVNPADEKIHKVALTPEGFAQGIWVALSVPEKSRRLPAVIHAAASGDFGPFLDLDVAKRPGRRYYNGMHLSVVCPEETLQIKRGEIARAYSGTFMPRGRADEYVAACRIWSPGPQSRDTLAPVVADIPTLIVTGEADPITPPELGEQVSRTLPNSRHVIIKGLSHESDGVIGAECLDQLFAAFLYNPDPKSLDVGCIRAMEAPPFSIEE